ncbi:filamentous hemagglutinin family protein [Aliirhizobium terrae]|uniref:filamentous haemagglutinin family protein n=1 Tax=Terrirhizobium terrae TaxID=2926709 RepID=UPI002577A8B5|nr:filamentous haemagglutinin family protein [Rhizobium sp. CC-CFT758]WJH41202.1 filamentous hemagglutinin family protein [Rhizobium sp. CC-CFT758]
MNADLLDVQREVRFGMASTFGTASSGGVVTVDRRGFDDVELTSSGDLRFLPGADSNGTSLRTRGDLVMSARQLYPTTGANATIRAGVLRGNGANITFDPARALTIRSTGAAPDQQPHSVFGSLSMEATTINQGGTIRAPLGLIQLGSGNSSATAEINLLPGSITSTSSRGLVMPYGGTVDDIDWFHAGKEIALEGVVSSNQGVVLSAGRIDIQGGARIDLSGGGDLLGAGFISGRGGSVDVLATALANANPAYAASRDGNAVYAIVPGYTAGQAPVGGSSAAPLTGQQITLDRGLPGLPAGTYTLMPASYALMPGAFRIEIGAADPRGVTGGVTMANGSTVAGGTLGYANSQVRESLQRQVILTPADTVRKISQYNETTYAEFALADAARIGVPRAMIPLDGKTLTLRLTRNGVSDAFSFDGKVDFTAAKGGFTGSAAVIGSSGGAAFEVLATGAMPTTGFDGVSLHAGDLNALGAGRLVVGGRPQVNYGQQGNYFTFNPAGLSSSASITLREGAVLRAPEVMLLTASASGAITIEAGAGINTLGMGATPFDSRDGFIYSPQPNNLIGASMLAISNGWLDVLPADATVTSQGAILIGACGASGNCAAPTTLYSEGTIAFATTNRFELGDNVRYGTRNLSFGVGAVNIGTEAALAAASASSALPSGLTLNQAVLDRLLRGDTSTGAPALESLILNASEAVNIFGTVTLDTYDASGKSRIANLVLGTPAIYGAGTASDVATIRTQNLVWSGSTRAPGAIITGGAGSGSGSLTVDAERITLGYGPSVQISGIDTVTRLALGFANVTFDASDRITANHKGSIVVYQSRGAYAPATGYSYTGGNLTLMTPMLTGEAGSNSSIKAGGTITAVTPGGAAPAKLTDNKGLGAELKLEGQAITLATTVALPSGRFTASAEGDVILTDAAQLDLAGRKITMHDVAKYSWGGEVILESRSGNARQSAGSAIDLSAQHNHAGRLSVAALGAGAGTVDLQGRILGSTSGEYDAGGTIVPYLGGYIDLRAQRLGDSGTLTDQFAALNARLNANSMYGGRSFQFKQGDLVIGDGLKAGEIGVSVDGGSLTVTGTVDASGAEVGVIRLAAKQGLTIAGTALLDAHGKRLRVDSYGKIIDSPNRAVVELNSGDGLLTLGSGMRVDLRHGTDVPVGTRAGMNDGAARGTLDLYAPRLGGATAGDIAIDASGTINITGARSIAVNAVQRYEDAPDGTDPAASGRPYQVIDQAYLDAKHIESTAFIGNALANGGLMNGKLAGLNNATYRDAFHLRPGVEIVSATPDGDLVVQGDLDLSGYRYQSVNPNFPRTGVIGSGEVGSLAIRAGGNLAIHGSINDGFAPPPETPDDDGWMLREGLLSYGSDVVAPRRLTLADGTGYPDGRAVNYDLPLKQMQAAAGTLLPVEAVTATVVTLPANTILGGDIRAADGTLLFAAGTRLAETKTLPAGTRLGAGFVLPVMTTLNALTWPKGVPLPTVMEYNEYNVLVVGKVRIAGSVDVPMGGLIPSQAEIELPGNAISLPLRPVDGNGRQGANWAVASMLPAGSQSWSMRMVAGADTAAADQRALRPRDANGNLTLADTHFTVFDKREVIVIPGTPEVPGFVWYWSETNEFGMPAGTEITPDWGPDSLCADVPDWCVKVSFVWDELGAELGMTPGTPVSADWEIICADPGWCIRLRDPIPGTPPTTIIGDVIEKQPANPIFSVLRTGTGDLDIVAGGNISMRSPYGVYTAGTQSQNVQSVFNQSRATTTDGTVLGSAGADYEAIVKGTNSTYQAWYPTLGGNLLLRAGGDITGDAWTSGNSSGTDGNRNVQKTSADPANWLWRQGDVADSANGAAWWINFGTYVRSDTYPTNDVDRLPYLVGFTGYGTLGGGDLRLETGGNAGTVDVLSPGGWGSGKFPRSQALTLAVASTGRVGADGNLTLTGGGDMDVRIGGALNPARDATITVSFENREQNLGLNGLVANLRGHTGITAASQGSIELRYGPFAAHQDAKEVRAYDAFTSTSSYAGGGLMLMPGDSTFSLAARGDLVLGGVRDGGRTNSIDPNIVDATGNLLAPWFTLWTDRTAIDLFAAGGDLTPSTQLGQTSGSGDGITPQADTGATGGRFVYPSILRAAAPAGSIYMGPSAVYQNSAANQYSLLLAPSANGQLELLAGNSIYAGGYAVTRSGADPAVMPTPFNPATMNNLSSLAFQVANNLFAFGTNTASGLYDLAPARYYAVNGDIVGLRTGEVLSNFSSVSSLAGRTIYEAGGPVWIRAGRDIVNSGTNLSQFTHLPNNGGAGGQSTGNLIVHSSETDVSVVSAGRDILYSSFSIAGPGSLEISAGRNILMEDRAGIVSLGAIIPGDTRPGASIHMQAGVGAAGPDYAAIAKRYLDPANLAAPDLPLADQPGKTVKVYAEELAEWLEARYGFEGSGTEALAFFGTLAPEQQAIFLRQVYYAELTAGGREYNDADGPRYLSYLRGREAIATLFPEKDADGATIARGGDIIMYGGAGVRTNFGGDISMLAPEGRIVIGVDGTVPPSTAGLVTQGAGNIHLYSKGSLLLGLSRIMTTMGGDVLAWSAEGDINAGRGAKTTIVYTPPRRVYDNYGLVTISPEAPSSGAGIASQSAVPGIPGGDIDLIAPLGTIDAGEAGIRSGANVNVAALHVVNAANIQAQGSTTGVPQIQAPDIGGLTEASNTSGAAAQQATGQTQEREAGPVSVIIVEVLGFGGGDTGVAGEDDERDDDDDSAL